MVSSLFTYRLTDAGLTPFGNYSFYRRLPKGGPWTDLHSLTAGIRGAARKLVFEGSLGYTRNISLLSGLTSQDYSVSATLGYQPMERAGVFLMTRHNSSVTVAGSTTRKYDFSVGARLALAKRCIVEPGVTYSLQNTSDGMSISELGYHCRASYTLLRYVDGFLSAERVEEGNSLGVRITNNRLQMGVFVRF